jgi:regulator of protease activity HflC (stomatin/prohibitin superfamily)
MINALMVPFTIVFVVLVLGSIKQINQYEKGVKFTFGKYTGSMNPGWRIVLPVVQSYKKVDLRVKAVDVPDQEAITKDNISVGVNAVIYYKVSQAEKAIIEVENFYYAISQLAQTTMRNAVGQVELDELLSQRDRVSENIRSIIDKESDPWGIKVINVELKDVTLAEEMKRTIAKQAEAEREKRAIIIKAEGEVAAAENMAKAANILSGSAGALHLRTLQSMNDISSDQSNTIVFATPIEVLKAFEGFSKKI